MWKKPLRIAVWSLTAVGTCTLLVAAVQKREEKKCADIKIEINGAHNHVFVDKKEILHANIEEREPMARVFTLQGKSYYIDSSCNRLPLSDKLSARVPMFTSFPSDKKILSRPDSLVLMNIKQIAQFIEQDSI